MRSTIIAILSILLAAVLVLTNPDEQDFARAYADRLNAELADEIGLRGPVGDIIGGVTQRALESALAEEVRRTDYLVASVFRLPAAREDLRVLGFLGQFVTLSDGP